MDKSECKALPIIQTIAPLKDGKKYKAVHPNLPQSPFILGIFSPRQTGKSTLISFLLLHDTALGQDYYDKVYIFSPTVEQDDTSRFLLERFMCDTVYSDDKLQNIINKQKEFKKKTEMPHICIVIDDAIGDDSMKRNSLLTSFITKSRHWNADVILSLQSFKSCPKVSRINLTDILIGYPIPSQAMKKDLIEEFADNFEGGEEEYMRIYHEATQKKRFNFMNMKLKENPVHVYRNFEEKIFPLGDAEIE
tara:strand:+ start:212 stop:958 length:747 start_codon:yes stop_codon:yes gene_type:complete